MTKQITSTIAQEVPGHLTSVTNGLKPGTKLTPVAKIPKFVPMGKLATSDSTIVRSRSKAGTLTYRHAAFSDEQGRVDPAWIEEFAMINREMQDATYRRPTRRPTKQEQDLAA